MQRRGNIWSEKRRGRGGGWLGDNKHKVLAGAQTRRGKFLWYISFFFRREKIQRKNGKMRGEGMMWRRRRRIIYLSLSGGFSSGAKSSPPKKGRQSVWPTSHHTAPHAAQKGDKKEGRINEICSLQPLAVQCPFFGRYKAPLSFSHLPLLLRSTVERRKEKIDKNHGGSSSSCLGERKEGGSIQLP